MLKIPENLKGGAKVDVTHANTATAFCSGGVEVFATPALVALMEKAAYDSLLPYLEEGESTVGVDISVKHIAATPVGCTVRAESVLTEQNGRRLTFTVTAFDDYGRVGEAVHTRALIGMDRFFAGIDKRKNG